MPTWFLLLALVPSAVIPSFHKADPRIRAFQMVARVAAGEGQDLLVVLGTPQERPSQWWEKNGLLGLFLQDRERPARLYQLAMLPGRDCLPRVEHAAPGELLLSCEVEKGQRAPNIKFFYSTQSKTVRQLDYAPFSVPLVRTVSGVPHFIAGNSKDILVIRPAGEGFEIVPGKEILAKARFSEWSTPEGLFRMPQSDELKAVRFGPGTGCIVVDDPDPSWGHRRTRVVCGSSTYPLPQSNCAQFKQARPAATKLNGCPHEFQEDIGPYQVTGEKLWFGKTFYDSEGMGGIGAAGYFDAAKPGFVLFSPREIADSSVSALLVEPDRVWLGLTGRHEYGDSSGGLLESDASMKVIRKHAIGGIAAQIVRSNGVLYIATSTGIAVLRGGEVQRYIVDINRAGRYFVTLR